MILDTLYEQCVKAGVRFYSEFSLVDLMLGPGGCCGALFLELATGERHEVRSRALLLATGGFGKLFKTSSSRFANTGDAQSIVFRSGLPLQDMEFIQFHPTGVRGLGILISEPARGERGILRNDLGEPFMARYAPTIKDLAPRDVVARSILREVLEGRGIGGADYVHLDLTPIGEDRIREGLWEIASFARIYAGVDVVKEPIPVLPTCHYMMGGIPADVDGRVLRNAAGDRVAGLYAAGECGCVSVHGANRLGCNSLLELVVFGRRAGKAMLAWLQEGEDPGEPTADSTAVGSAVEALRMANGKERASIIRREIQECMAEHCSVFRDEAGLRAASAKLEELWRRYRQIGISVRQTWFNTELRGAMECEHLLRLPTVIVASALSRNESRGA